MSRLNYHHLQYFWAVAREGNLTRAAEQLNLSQSALSTQIRQLEEQLKVQLFDRVSRRLVLTEAGRLTYEYAQKIFATGEEMLASLSQSHRSPKLVLKIGFVATLSRNFLQGFLEPLLSRPDLHLILQSASLEELLDRLADHSVDLVLSNRSVQPEPQRPWRCQAIDRQAVSLVGHPRGGAEPFRFPQNLSGLKLLLPGSGSQVRAAFDSLFADRDWPFEVLAEVDDMALLRVLARSAPAAAVVPAVVVRDELKSGLLEEYCKIPGLYETFYAISIRRQYQHPLVRELLTIPQKAT